MPAVLCLSMLLEMAVPPPSLEQVQDDTDVPDAAFVELVDYVQSMSHDGAVRVEIDHAAALAEPGRYRGLSITISGRLEQHRSLGRPFHSVQEWFIRDEAGAPWAVYVIGCDPAVVRDGRHVTLTGVLYKRFQLRDRSGDVRSYPAMVAMNPIWTAGPVPAAQGGRDIWMLLGLLGIGLIVVLVLGRRLKRHSSIRPVIVVPDDDEPMELPDEPAEALRELKRRGDGHTG